LLDLFEIFGPLNISKTELVPIGRNITKIVKVCFLDLILNFVIKRMIFGHKIFKMELLDNFEQASKQKRMVVCFLEI
jgi:hypothetical protein